MRSYLLGMVFGLVTVHFFGNKGALLALALVICLDTLSIARKEREEMHK
jgi:hypothetical protein